MKYSDCICFPFVSDALVFVMSTNRLCFYVKVIVVHLSSGFTESWAAGFSLSPGEKSEQEYLLALCAQYEVEQYEDCYNLMG